jgi:hypothetical protein
VSVPMGTIALMAMPLEEMTMRATQIDTMWF